MFKSLTAALGLLALAGSEAALAGAWTIGNGSGNAGTQVTVPVNFAGDGVTISSQITVSVAAPLSVVSATPQNGQACSASGNSVTIVLFSFSALPGAATNYCNITLAIATGTPASPPTLPVTGSAQLCAISGGGAAPTCTAANGAITVTGGGGNTPPTIAYNPTTGTTINYTGAGTASSIVATPSGGAGSGAAATTTVGACTISGGGAAFPTTNIAQLSFVGNTVTPQNIALPNCVPQAGGETNATLTCPESAGGGAAVNRTWPLVCPQAAVGATPPTLTYNPASGSTTNVNAGNNLTINVGCPNDGAACGGTGSGLGATSRLNTLVATYTGLASPAPSMQCNFVTEGGAVVVAPLDFVATQADSGDIRCTCPVNSTGLPTEPFQVTVQESSPASGGVTATRTFNITCQGAPPPACGTISANPPSGTLTLTNGGAATQIMQAALAGAGAGVSHTVNCSLSGVSSGTVFTITTSPSPLTLNNVTTTGTVSASCTNSLQTQGSGTLTCTSTASGASGCASLSAQYTLQCPGAGGPPPGPLPSVPVPALGEQGRILLAALMLLLGLGVVGFRMRG
ncbi:MAG: hypothetical protein DYH17_01710 [Xanthomonadales bacterium PRO6]|nr:hypothetical protein [Xanthomonadales bacterium PRO6]